MSSTLGAVLRSNQKVIDYSRDVYATIALMGMYYSQAIHYYSLKGS